ncbi:MAG: hypothetical protein RR807_04680 [Oscillospiraceae bacterium]
MNLKKLAMRLGNAPCSYHFFHFFLETERNRCFFCLKQRFFDKQKRRPNFFGRRFLRPSGGGIFARGTPYAFTEVIALESVQRDMMCVLLKRLFQRGLISAEAYEYAQNAVHSATGLPDFFRVAAPLTKGGDALGGTQTAG